MKVKKILCLFVLICALALALCAVACNTPEDPAPTPDPAPDTPPAPEKLTYTVTLLDGNGNHMNNVIVKIMKGDEQISMKVYNGSAITFEAEADTYTVDINLSQLDVPYSYDQSLCTLTAENPSTTVRFYLNTPSAGSVFVGAPISSDYPAYSIGEGSFLVTLTPNDYTFFVFTPSAAAVYTVTYECNTDLAISYHGGTHFVQGIDLTGDSTDIVKYENGISINVYESNLGGSYVLAVKSTSADKCILRIKNVGDPGTRLEDQPWTPYTEEASKIAQHLNTAASATGTFTTVDVTEASLRAVFNDADGYYHLGTADGPILYIDLTTDTAYIPSVQIICANQRMGLYVYDDNGNVIEKRSFNELFHQYGMPTDDTAPEGGPVRVPLTQKLAEAIQSFGEKSEWWKPGSEKNIFSNAGFNGYNQAFAWLLFCGYYA